MKTFVVLIFLLMPAAFGQGVSEKFRFTTDYYFQDLKGRTQHRERLAGTYTRDWTAGKATWMDVTLSKTENGSERLGPDTRRDFMEGFTYPLGAPNATEPEFFEALPPSAIQERNLVWDSRMFEIYGEEHFPDVKPNVTYHVPGSAEIPLAGAGTFQNKDPQLDFSGTSQCNGEQCAVVDYRAFFNPFELRLLSQTLVGRSHYWGQIWISLKTHRIVRGTLYEDVLGEVRSPESAISQPVNIFRIALFERIED